MQQKNQEYDLPIASNVTIDYTAESFKILFFSLIFL